MLTLSVPEKLKPLLAPCRYKGAYGGRGGGKSHFFAQCLVLRCLAGTTRAVCIREVQTSLKESVHQLIKDKIGEMGLGRAFTILGSEIRARHNDSLIIFKGMQSFNAVNIKSLEGFDIAWVEEAQAFSQDSLDMLRPTIRKPGSELWFSWNPENDDDAVDMFFRGSAAREDRICVQINGPDNPWFPDVLHADMAADFTADRSPGKVVANHVWMGAYKTIIEGAYYTHEMQAVRQAGQIRHEPYDPAFPVSTFWDIGRNDQNVIWFYQNKRGRECMIDYLEDQHKSLQHYVRRLRERGYLYDGHFLPHDGARHEWMSEQNRSDTLESLTGVPVSVVKRTKLVLSDIQIGSSIWTATARIMTARKKSGWTALITGPPAMARTGSAPSPWPGIMGCYPPIGGRRILRVQRTARARGMRLGGIEGLVLSASSKFTNEVQHQTKVMPWDEHINKSLKVRDIALPIFMKMGSPSAKSLQLWIARHQQLLES